VITKKVGEEIIAALNDSDKNKSQTIIFNFTNPLRTNLKVEFSMVLTPNEIDSYDFLAGFNQMAEALGDQVTYDFKFNLYGCPGCTEAVIKESCADSKGNYCNFQSKIQ
jgi:hypothetical protein